MNVVVTITNEEDSNEFFDYIESKYTFYDRLYRDTIFKHNKVYFYCSDITQSLGFMPEFDDEGIEGWKYYRDNPDIYGNNIEFLTFNEFKNKYMNTNTEIRNITIDIKTARKWYNSNNELLKAIVLQAFSEEELEENKYPNTWEKCIDKYEKLYYIKGTEANIDYCETYNDNKRYSYFRNCVPSEKLAKQVRALEQLLVCRDAWRNGWVSSNNDTIDRGAIYRNGNNLEVSNTVFNDCILQFPTKEIAEKFLNTFRNLIEEAGDLI